MPDSTAEVYLHFVWATKWREDSIPGDLERDVHRVISVEVRRLGCDVVAIGGMLDHIHLLVKFGRTVTFARFMEQIKGVASAFINDRSPAILGDAEKMFRWQPGYGVFSVGPNQVERVIAYIRDQKQHHTEGRIHVAWEPPDAPQPPNSTTNLPPLSDASP